LVAPPDPFIVRWSAHALVRAESLGVPRRDVEDGLASHAHRRGNPREADWLIDLGRLTVAYNHPADGDESVALVVTVWRRA
jgi:hypothetical protein